MGIFCPLFNVTLGEKDMAANISQNGLELKTEMQAKMD